MPRKLPHTPRSIIRNAIRQCWLRSRERMNALKRTRYTCEQCGAKQSKAKGREVVLEVHHTKLADLERLIDLCYELLLHPSDTLKVLCKDCHKQLHGGE